MKTHRFDGVSFFAGLAITLVGLLYLIPTEPADLVDVISSLGGWVWPVILVVIGIAVLVPVLWKPRSDKGDQPEDQAV